MFYQEKEALRLCSGTPSEHRVEDKRRREWSYYSWRLQSFSSSLTLFCNRRLSEKHAGIDKKKKRQKRLGGSRFWWIWNRVLFIISTVKQLYCRATAPYAHCVNMLTHIYIYALKPSGRLKQVQTKIINPYRSSGAFWISFGSWSCMDPFNVSLSVVSLRPRLLQLFSCCSLLISYFFF